MGVVVIGIVFMGVIFVGMVGMGAIVVGFVIMGMVVFGEVNMFYFGGYKGGKGYGVMFIQEMFMIDKFMEKFMEYSNY